MASTLKIGFLGAGKMASALARGFIASKIVTPKQVMASDLAEAPRAGFAQQTGAAVTDSNLEVVRFASVLMLAVKPDQVATVLDDVKGAFADRHLLVSIAAGVPLRRIEDRVPVRTRVIRVMPNTPALVGACAAGFALGENATAEDSELVVRLFSAVGIAFPVKESLLDAVTGLSGSGPAYGFLMIEALSDGGVAAGLPREISTRLAAQTLLGAARMVLETGQHPGALKDAVSSPGGTTIDGIHELEKGGVRGALMNAVRAAAEKSARLGQG